MMTTLGFVEAGKMTDAQKADEMALSILRKISYGRIGEQGLRAVQHAALYLMDRKVFEARRKRNVK